MSRHLAIALSALLLFSALPVTASTKPVNCAEWRTGVVTTYARHFEGRRMACGRRFSHRGNYVACRGGRFGQRIEMLYGKNGRAIVMIGDRGKLPLHRKGQWQFDLPQSVAKQLGLYRVEKGKTDRKIRWRYL